jgi:hypothetical protein
LFNTLRIRRLTGRLLTPADEDEKQNVAVINEALSSRYFGHQNPISRQVQVSVRESGTKPAANFWFEIVGVVSDVKNRDLREAAVPEAYLPYTVAGLGVPKDSLCLSAPRVIRLHYRCH